MHRHDTNGTVLLLKTAYMRILEHSFCTVLIDIGCQATGFEKGPDFHCMNHQSQHYANRLTPLPPLIDRNKAYDFSRFYY